MDQQPQELSPLALRSLSPRVRQLMTKLMPPQIQQAQSHGVGRRIDYSADNAQAAGRATRQRNRRNA